MLWEIAGHGQLISLLDAQILMRGRILYLWERDFCIYWFNVRCLLSLVRFFILGIMLLFYYFFISGNSVFILIFSYIGIISILYNNIGNNIYVKAPKS